MKYHLRKRLWREMRKRKRCRLNTVPEKGYATRAKANFCFCEKTERAKDYALPVPAVLACGTDQKQVFLSPSREQGSIVEVLNAKRPRTRLLTINVSHINEKIGAMEQKLLPLGLFAGKFEDYRRTGNRMKPYLR